MISLFLSCSEPERTEPDCSTYNLLYHPYSAEEYELMMLLNTYRIQNNLSHVIPNNHIGSVCFRHTRWMIENNTYNHSGFQDRFDNIQCILNASRVGECVGYNYYTPQSMLNALINSPSHYMVIRSDANLVGCSIQTNEQGRKTFSMLLVKN
jgi:uncharacterized protein YkwD